MLVWLIPVFLAYFSALIAISIVSGAIGGWVASRMKRVFVGIIIPFAVPLWFVGIYLGLSMLDVLIALLVSYSSFYLTVRRSKSKPLLV